MSRSRAVTVAGAALWLTAPLALVAELVAAQRSQAPYSLLHNTISDLGATTCTTIPYPSEDVAVCSPAHALVNGSFVLLGLAMALGALLLHRNLRSRAPSRRRTATAATVVWVVCGVSTVGAGLTPLDRALEAHALVSVPAIVVCGAAMALTGAALTRQDPRWRLLTVLGVLAAVVGLVMVLRLEVRWGGLLERLALWPSYAAMPVVAWHLLRDRTASAAPSASSAPAA
jgi:hypothetical membrane protein